MNSVSIQELSVRSLYTFGFIKALLERYFQTYYIFILLTYLVKKGKFQLRNVLLKI